MKKRNILEMKRLPSRLSKEEAAILLGFKAHEIPILVSGKLLKPLGDPSPYGAKFFCAADIAEKGSDANFLNRATKAVQKYWKENHKNRRDRTTVT